MNAAGAKPKKYEAQAKEGKQITSKGEMALTSLPASGKFFDYLS